MISLIQIEELELKLKALCIDYIAPRTRLFSLLWNEESFLPLNNWGGLCVCIGEVSDILISDYIPLLTSSDEDKNVICTAESWVV